MHSKLFAVMATVGLVLFALGPGVATAAAQTAGNDSLAIHVTQDGPAVTVTDNGTGVANATVTVGTVDNGSYDGVGEYTTDENGTVGLPAPESNVTVEATTTVDNATVSTTANLTVTSEGKASFGSVVAAFVHSLQDGNQTNIGRHVAEFVTANNPGNAPDHAGPPEHAGPNGHHGNETGQAGPPADHGNGTAGPPAKASKGKNGDAGPPAKAGKDKNGTAGPPAKAGKQGADEEEVGATDEKTDEQETENKQTADAETGDGGDSGGPPSNANAGGNGR